MSNFSRTKLFWAGSKGCNAARVAETQRQEELQARMARDRVVARYQELLDVQGRGDPTRADPLEAEYTGMWALQATSRRGPKSRATAKPA